MLNQKPSIYYQDRLDYVLVTSKMKSGSNIQSLENDYHTPLTQKKKDINLKELVDLIRDSRSGGWTDLDHTDSETDWNWSAFGEDVAKTLAVKVAGAMEYLPKKYGYTTPWVISTCGNLAMIEKVCAVD